MDIITPYAGRALRVQRIMKQLQLVWYKTNHALLYTNVQFEADDVQLLHNCLENASQALDDIQNMMRALRLMSLSKARHATHTLPDTLDIQTGTKTEAPIVRIETLDIDQQDYKHIVGSTNDVFEHASVQRQRHVNNDWYSNLQWSNISYPSERTDSASSLVYVPTDTIETDSADNELFWEHINGSLQAPQKT